ncbi:hypothetical protein I6F11_12980 [Ensifer sp. NBAIM29]|nr:hypothetical protein [Ensifer sp. NBAIM29]
MQQDPAQIISAFLKSLAERQERSSVPFSRLLFDRTVGSEALREERRMNGGPLQAIGLLELHGYLFGGRHLLPGCRQKQGGAGKEPEGNEDPRAGHGETPFPAKAMREGSFWFPARRRKRALWYSSEICCNLQRF